MFKNNKLEQVTIQNDKLTAVPTTQKQAEFENELEELLGHTEIVLVLLEYLENE